MYLILAGFLFLFFKINFTLYDDSLVYIFSNVLGYLLIRIGIEKSDETEEMDMKDSLWFYVTMNLVLLLCVVFGVSVETISLSYLDAYILALTLLFGHIYLFVYPIYLFSRYISYLESRSICNQTHTIQWLLAGCILLAVFITIGVVASSAIQYLWIVVVGIQAYTLFLLKKKSQRAEFIMPFEE